MDGDKSAPYTGSLLTLDSCRLLIPGAGRVQCSLDLGKSLSEVECGDDHWCFQGSVFPYLDKCKDRTIYFWDASLFEPVARYSGRLIKLVPTRWGPPTFEIDGIKMLLSEHLSPYDDAKNKLDLINPAGKRVLDTCGGLGYFAVMALRGGVREFISHEKNADVIWLRQINPWSPRLEPRLTLQHVDVLDVISRYETASFDAILHDPPRISIAGDLYSAAFYAELSRVLRRGGTLFHYTGTPHKVTRGRNVQDEVIRRLQAAGFNARQVGDGVLATKIRSVA